MRIPNLKKLTQISVVLLLLAVCFKRYNYSTDIISNPGRLLKPAAFGTVETKTYNDGGFIYRVPVPEGGCFDSPIPCVPYPLKNVVMRGLELKNGFRINFVASE